MEIITFPSSTGKGIEPRDLLAKMGLELEEFTRFNAQTTPRLLKAIVRLEEMGVPNIRVCDEDQG